MPPKIEIKGIRDGLLVTVGSGKWPEILAALLEYIQGQNEFFQGAKLTLDVANHILKAAELGNLRDQLSDHGVLLRGVLSHSPTTEQAAQSLGLATRVFSPHPDRSTRPFDTRIEGDAAILVQRTLRSGNSLKYMGHVTIIGDVNPGAEIIAGGNIVVWGCLRGTVHAGAQGDENAVVCALVLSPTQLRIAGKISITPSQEGSTFPEIARLQGDQVVADPWNFHKRDLISTA